MHLLKFISRLSIPQIPNMHRAVQRAKAHCSYIYRTVLKLFALACSHLDSISPYHNNYCLQTDTAPTCVREKKWTAEEQNLHIFNMQF